MLKKLPCRLFACVCMPYMRLTAQAYTATHQELDDKDTWYCPGPRTYMHMEPHMHALPCVPQELDDKDTWYRLGVEALRQGNHQIVEFSYQKTKAYEREWLNWLHLFECLCQSPCRVLKKLGRTAEARSACRQWPCPPL